MFYFQSNRAKKKTQMKKKAISTYSRLKTVKKISKYKFRWSQLEQFPLSVCFLVAVFLFLFFLYFSFFGSLWITICNQPALSTLLSLPFISTFFCLCSNLPRCGVRSHDCLYSRRHHLEHAQLWLFTHPAWPHGRPPPPPSAPPSPHCPFPARLAVECQPPGPLVVANQFHQRGSKTN